MLIKFRYVDTLLLEICLTLYLAARVKLRRTGAVRVSASDLGFLARDVALLSHNVFNLSGSILPWVSKFAIVSPTSRRICYANRHMELQIIAIVALIMSIVLHEMAHGYAANALGDPTARLQGRLSPNPLVHIDPLGSVIIPALLLLSSSGILFGWAKPVPYNPYNLNNQKWGEALVAIAGPAINIFIALVFALLIRLADPLGLNSIFVSLASYIVYMNILLAFFNLIPFPPLDGSKILPALLPFSGQMAYQRFVRQMEGFGFFVTIIFIFLFINVFWMPFSQVVGAVFELMTGMRWF